MPRNELTPSAPSPARQVRNKWGATALDNAQFADHHGSISLLTDDPNVRKAAEFKLELERKLRPTEEEREQKLAEIAADALARREAGRARLAGLKEAREGAEEVWPGVRANETLDVARDYGMQYDSECTVPGAA